MHGLLTLLLEDNIYVSQETSNVILPCNLTICNVAPEYKQDKSQINWIVWPLKSTIMVNFQGLKTAHRLRGLSAHSWGEHWDAVMWNYILLWPDLLRTYLLATRPTTYLLPTCYHWVLLVPILLASFQLIWCMWFLTSSLLPPYFPGFRGLMHGGRSHDCRPLWWLS